MYANSVDSNCDWFFINKIYNILYYFGVVPFQSHQINQPKSHSRTVFIVLLFLILNLCTVEQFFFNMKLYQRVSQLRKIMDFTEMVMEAIILNFLLLSANFFHGPNWRNFFMIMDDLEIFFAGKPCISTTLKKLSLPPVLFISLNLTVTLYEIVILKSGIKFLAFYVNNLYQIMCYILIINILQLLKRRYESLYQILKGCIRQKHPNNERKIEDIQSIIEIFRKTNKVIKEFNRIFGWFLFFTLPYLVLLFVYFISLTVADVRIVEILISFFCYCLLYFVSDLKY